MLYYHLISLTKLHLLNNWEDLGARKFKYKLKYADHERADGAVEG